MRTAEEIFEIILNFAKTDNRVRAVYMNGSRPNPHVQKDKYRDYDVVFAVTETQSFLAHKAKI